MIHFCHIVLYQVFYFPGIYLSILLVTFDHPLVFPFYKLLEPKLNRAQGYNEEIV